MIEIFVYLVIIVFGFWYIEQRGTRNFPCERCGKDYPKRLLSRCPYCGAENS